MQGRKDCICNGCGASALHQRQKQAWCRKQMPQQLPGDPIPLQRLRGKKPPLPKTSYICTDPTALSDATLLKRHVRQT